MAKPILIVGGGPAGLAAAHSLATFGQECILVDKEDRFGGAPILEGYAKLVPSGEWAKDAIGGMVDRAVGHELVDGPRAHQGSGHRGSRVETVSGSRGR